jgi:hypothetical protein
MDAGLGSILVLSLAPEQSVLHELLLAPTSTISCVGYINK